MFQSYPGVVSNSSIMAAPAPIVTALLIATDVAMSKIIFLRKAAFFTALRKKSLLWEMRKSIRSGRLGHSDAMNRGSDLKPGLAWPGEVTDLGGKAKGAVVQSPIPLSTTQHLRTGLNGCLCLAFFEVFDDLLFGHFGQLLAQFLPLPAHVLYCVKCFFCLLHTFQMLLLNV